jgi:hypothetical protein
VKSVGKHEVWKSHRQKVSRSIEVCSAPERVVTEKKTSDNKIGMLGSTGYSREADGIDKNIETFVFVPGCCAGAILAREFGPE